MAWGQDGEVRPTLGSLGLPVVIVVLRGDDDHNGEYGAEHDGGDSHRQTDEGEITCLARGDLCCNHIASSHSGTHLNQEIVFSRYLGK